MRKYLKIAVVLFFVALAPMKAVAGVAIGSCGAGHSHQVPAEHPPSSACMVCAEHCGNSSFAALVPAEMSPPPAGSACVSTDETLRSRVAPERLDRPPLRF